MAAKLPFPKPANSAQYAADFDVFAGAPMPLNPAALAVTSAWVQSESPSFPGSNGFGTELYLPGAVPDPSNNKVYDYKTLQDGLRAALDMMNGGGPQTTPLAPKFVADLQSGNATASQMVADINSGNGSTSWAGAGPDTYDSTAILNKLQSSNFSITGAAAQTTGLKLIGPFSPGGPFPLGGQLGSVIPNAAKGLTAQIQTLVLKGILTLMGASMIVYGFTLLADRGGGSKPNPADLAALVAA